MAWVFPVRSRLSVTACCTGRATVTFAGGHDQQGDYLLVVNDKNIVERRPVTTGAAVESRRVIATGLTGGEWVVVNGVLKAAPGRPVTPEREGAPGPEARPSPPAKKAAP